MLLWLLRTYYGYACGTYTDCDVPQSREKGPMGSARYFVLRQGVGRIFVTSLHFTNEKAPMFTLSQPTTGYCMPTHLPSTSLIQFSACISSMCGFT